MGRPAVLKVDIVSDARGVNKGVSQAESRLGKLGNAAKKVGKLAGVGLAAAGVAAGAFAVSSIKAASDVEQSFGGLESVFGKNADAVKEWANAGAKSVGLAKSDYASLATIVGSQLQNMGRSSKQAAGQTHDLIGLGADLSATFGGSVADAVGAVSSLLKGERDPIERYGVSIKQADINARLASQGLSGLTGKALAQAQATAALDLLTKQTTASHGAFARETDTLAHQQQVLSAQFDNTKAAIGAKLLPVATKLFTWFNNKLLPGAKVLGAELQAKLGPTITKVGAFITGKLVPAASSLYRWFVQKIVPAIRAYVTPILAGLRSAFARVSSSIEGNSGNLSKLGHFLSVVIPPAAKVLGKILGGTLGTGFRVLGFAIGAVITLISKLVGLVDAVVSKLRGLASLASHVGGVLGHLNPFGSAQLLTAVPQLAGRSAGVGPMIGQLATASAGDAGGGWSTIRAAAGGVTIVDRRTVDARLVVEGDVLDQVGLARKLQNVGRDHAVRVGRALSYGAGGTL